MIYSGFLVVVVVVLFLETNLQIIEYDVGYFSRYYDDFNISVIIIVFEFLLNFWVFFFENIDLISSTRCDLFITILMVMAFKHAQNVAIKQKSATLLVWINVCDANNSIEIILNFVKFFNILNLNLILFN